MKKTTTKKSTTKKTITKKKTLWRPVLVTTSHRGVFFGLAKDTSGTTIHLRKARNVIYWTGACAGFLGLAKSGPMFGSRIGPEADIELRDITCVAEVRKKAAKTFREFVWNP